jgi:hypothetical protein
MNYIKIKSRGGVGKVKMNIVIRCILFILKLIIPKANPDYDDKIDLVANWLLEFEDEHSIPEREIGLDANENVIMKMPYKKNYGYWADNNLRLEDFKKTFEVVEITKEYSEEKWKAEPDKMQD